MVLVFILCAIIIFNILLFLAILVSTLHVKIENLELSNVHRVIDGPKIPKYKIEIALYLFNKVKWIWIHINHEKLKKMYQKMHLNKIDFKQVEQDIQIEDLKILKNIKLKISLFKLNLRLGTEDAILTSTLVFIISTFISILLGYTVKKYKNNQYYYEVKPVYCNQNIYEIKLNSIIEIKMVHIINIIYIFIKKKKGDNHERTSNRRSYGYSYE